MPKLLKLFGVTDHLGSGDDIVNERCKTKPEPIAVIKDYITSILTGCTGRGLIISFTTRLWPFAISASRCAQKKDPDKQAYQDQWSVHSQGFKPRTFWSVVRCSIQLSYGTNLFVQDPETSPTSVGVLYSVELRDPIIRRFVKKNRTRMTLIVMIY